MHTYKKSVHYIHRCRFVYQATSDCTPRMTTIGRYNHYNQHQENNTTVIIRNRQKHNTIHYVPLDNIFFL